MSSGEQNNSALRKPYSRDEDIFIISHILKEDGFDKVKGVSLWTDLETVMVKEGFNRSWQSLKERFRKTIIRNIEKYELDGESKKKLLHRFSVREVKKPPPKKTGRRAYYSCNEDEALARYVLRNPNKDVKGNVIWMDLERTDLLKGRSWMSMRNRFLHYIIPNIGAILNAKDALEVKRIVRGDLPFVDYESSDDEVDTRRPTETNVTIHRFGGKKRKLLPYFAGDDFDPPNDPSLPSTSRERPTTSNRPEKRAPTITILDSESQDEDETPPKRKNDHRRIISESEEELSDTKNTAPSVPREVNTTAPTPALSRSPVDVTTKPPAPIGQAVLTEVPVVVLERCDVVANLSVSSDSTIFNATTLNVSGECCCSDFSSPKKDAVVEESNFCSSHCRTLVGPPLSLSVMTAQAMLRVGQTEAQDGIANLTVPTEAPQRTNPTSQTVTAPPPTTVETRAADSQQSARVSLRPPQSNTSPPQPQMSQDRQGSRPANQDLRDSRPTPQVSNDSHRRSPNLRDSRPTPQVPKDQTDAQKDDNWITDFNVWTKMVESPQRSNRISQTVTAPPQTIVETGEAGSQQSTRASLRAPQSNKSPPQPQVSQDRQVSRRENQDLRDSRPTPPVSNDSHPRSPNLRDSRPTPQVPNDQTEAQEDDNWITDFTVSTKVVEAPQRTNPTSQTVTAPPPTTVETGAADSLQSARVSLRGPQSNTSPPQPQVSQDRKVSHRPNEDLRDLRPTPQVPSDQTEAQEDDNWITDFTVSTKMVEAPQRTNRTSQTVTAPPQTIVETGAAGSQQSTRASFRASQSKSPPQASQDCEVSRPANQDVRDSRPTPQVSNDSHPRSPNLGDSRPTPQGPNDQTEAQGDDWITDFTVLTKFVEASQRTNPTSGTVTTPPPTTVETSAADCQQSARVSLLVPQSNKSPPQSHVSQDRQVSLRTNQDLRDSRPTPLVSNDAHPRSSNLQDSRSTPRVPNDQTEAQEDDDWITDFAVSTKTVEAPQRTNRTSQTVTAPPETIVETGAAGSRQSTRASFRASQSKSPPQASQDCEVSRPANQDVRDSRPTPQVSNDSHPRSPNLGDSRPTLQGPNDQTEAQGDDWITDFTVLTKFVEAPQRTNPTSGTVTAPPPTTVETSAADCQQSARVSLLAPQSNKSPPQPQVSQDRQVSLRANQDLRDSRPAPLVSNDAHPRSSNLQDSRSTAQVPIDQTEAQEDDDWITDFTVSTKMVEAPQRTNRTSQTVTAPPQNIVETGAAGSRQSTRASFRASQSKSPPQESQDCEVSRPENQDVRDLRPTPQDGEISRPANQDLRDSPPTPLVSNNLHPRSPNLRDSRPTPDESHPRSPNPQHLRPASPDSPEAMLASAELPKDLTESLSKNSVVKSARGTVWRALEEDDSSSTDEEMTEFVEDSPDTPVEAMIEYMFHSDEEEPDTFLDPLNRVPNDTLVLVNGAYMCLGMPKFPVLDM